MSNFIVNAFMLPNACIDDGVLAEFKGAPLSVYIYIVRRTRGWGIQSRSISIAEFERSTGYKKDAIISALRLLESKKIIEAVRGYKSVTEYKLCDGVLDSEKQNQSSEVGKNDKNESNLVGKTESNLVGKTASIKTISFKANKKQSGYSEDFEKFWEAYPRCKRKSDKSGTFKTFEKYKSVVSTEMLIQILAAQKADQSWIKQDGEFIPAPMVWLNQKNWENEYWTEKLSKPKSQPEQQKTGFSFQLPDRPESLLDKLGAAS
ncbi:hypothetical protein ACX1NX_03025 [Acinetobacter sp. ANC 5383]